MEGGLPGSDLRLKRQHGISTAALLALAVVVLHFAAPGWSLFSVPQNLAYDLAFDYARPQPPRDIAIVAIDDQSLKQLGQFPFPRDLYAKLLDRLSGAKVVAFDILFTEPDRTGAQHDAAFAAAIRKHGNVVLGLYKQPVARLGEEPLWLKRMEVNLPAGPLPEGFPTVEEANLAGPIDSLAQVADVGSVDLEPDADGVYRRFFPLRYGLSRHVEVDHFGYVVAIHTQRMDEITMFVPPGRPSVLIDYCGPPGTIPTYSFAEVLAGQHLKELQGKIVLVGATAAGLYDMRPAPYRSRGRLFAGVETNANIVNTLLHGCPLRDATHSLFWLALALILGVLAGWLVWSGGEVTGPLLGVALVVLIAVPSFFLAFRGLGVVIPYGAFLWATILPVGVGAVERMGAERRLIQRQFGAYVSPVVLEELLHDPELVRQGQRREVTVLFSDVRGSTTLSESLPPETWIAQLNEYLSAMSAAVFEHDGYLDKFMGDGLLAVWNTFGTQPDHAARALATAERMLQLLDALNEFWSTQEDRAPFRIGIGLHSGEAIVGNVGSDQRTQYTVIGDVVNTGSRIESLTKEHQTPLLLSEATAALLPDRSRLREIGEVEIRGREGKISLFGLSGPSDTPRGDD
jgi:adenylate cyclase